MKRQITGLRAADRSAAEQVPDGIFLVRVQRARFRRQAQKPYYTLTLPILEPSRFGGQVISSRLYCSPKALWKLNWFLRDVGYDTELLGRDEVDESQLVGLTGVVKISHIVFNGASLLRLDGFAPAGNYGNINLTGQTALTLAPRVYNINSISTTGQSTISISPPRAVVINVAGQGQATPVDLEGGGLMNTTGIAGNFQINYAGTGDMKIAGGSAAYAVINAPNANLSFTGGSDFYGSAVAATVSDAGGTALHFDTTLLNNTTTPAANLNEISRREVAY